MPAATPPSPETLDDLVAQFSIDNDPAHEAVALEVGGARTFHVWRVATCAPHDSIYGEDAMKIWHSQENNHEHEQDDFNARKALNGGEPGTIRYEVTLNLPDPSTSVPTEEESAYPLTVLVSLPPTYPAAPPQLQLLSRYLGPYGVDAQLFGAVLRTYISRDGVEWVSGSVCVFDGLEWVKERCAAWVGERMSASLSGAMIREDERGRPDDADGTETVSSHAKSSAPVPEVPAQMPEGVEIIEAEPIMDRKSSFIGRACRITDPSQVPMILSHLMSDRKISRAAHPIINAWRCRVGSILHQDNDDDGESAAGGRLAHLLQILEVDNVLVIVTRYFGGIHLGPDRFKHINQAARNALELGGFLDAPEDNSHGGRRPGGKGKNARGQKVVIFMQEISFHICIYTEGYLQSY
ncbi:Protein IMPACT [Grifola frondosa]|uniref:Protein IMPACT n=1 Tax=Grifola frondosa TaxID=5627 RepID=A0A1C7M1N8_GRIFR|nr:Protein IMPACT [Grifola frondosa]